MEKLSTKTIKTLISTWLSKPEIRKELAHHTDPQEIICQEDINYVADIFEFKGSNPTLPQIEEHIWNLWCNGSNWMREEKRKLKDEWEMYLTEDGFSIDMLGDEDISLVKKYVNDPSQAEQCIFRLFIPNNELADNYRLEVVSTPEDDAIIGWTVIVD